jgi:choice-of-anchor B domain-containing protein
MLQRRAPVVLLLLLAAAGCGGSVTRSDEPVPSPSPAGAAAANMRLLAQVDLGGLTTNVHAHHDEPLEIAGAVSAAGNWGYTSPGGRRFALTGTSAGTSIVEVTDGARPRPVALIQGPASQWREIRTYGEYVYVTTEARHGLDIISMKDPDHPEKVRTWNRTFQSAHTLWIDEDRGLLFANGTNTARGTRVLDLRGNPEDPDEVGSFDGFYIHDAYTRGDTLFASAILDGFLALLDVSNPRRIREITRFNTGGRFTHNAWLTRDGNYVFTTDERPGRPLEGWDIRDPMAPRKVTEYIGAPNTIPHNVMIDGDRLLVAHYTEGVHLLDVSNPERPRVMGFYDTYPGTSTGFVGVWGAYIFPSSNLIVASDINGGLFVIEFTGR